MRETITEKFKTEIKKKLKAKGLTTKSLAIALGDAPMTASQRLNGWLPWTEEHTRKANKLLGAK